MKNYIRLISVTAVLLSFSVSTFAEEGEVDKLKDAIAGEKWDEAKSVGEALVVSEPENGEVYYLLGKAYAKLDEREAAVDAFKNAVKYESENADYFADYGYALIQRAQEMNMFQAGPIYMRGLDQYKRAVSINPDHIGAHIGLSRYYMNAPAIGGGSMKKAKEHAAEIARISPYLGHIENALIAEKENRAEDAIAEFEAAVSMESNNAWIHFELGKLYQGEGKMEAAKMAYEKTLQLQPEHEGAKAALTAFGA